MNEEEKEECEELEEESEERPLFSYLDYLKEYVASLKVVVLDEEELTNAQAVSWCERS